MENLCMYIMYICLSLSLVLALMRIVLIVINPSREKVFGIFVTVFFIIVVSSTIFAIRMILESPGFMYSVTVFSIFVLIYFIWDIREEYYTMKLDREIRKLQ